MNYIIMSAGNGRRWRNYLSTQKQLIKIDGEPILYRTIRLLRENGISNIYVTVRKQGQFGKIDAIEYINPINEVDIDRIWGAKELVPAIFFYGDVYYTEQAIRTILADERSYQFFGRKRPGYIKVIPELYAIKADDFVIQKAKELRDVYLAGKIWRCIGWELHQFCGNDHFTEIRDITEDFDLPTDYQKFLRRRRLYENKNVKRQTSGSGRNS